MTSLAPGHTASTWQSWDLILGLTDVQGYLYMSLTTLATLETPIENTKNRAGTQELLP